MVHTPAFCLNNRMTMYVDATVETRSHSRTTFLLATGGKLTVPTTGLSADLQQGAKAIVTIMPEREAALEREVLAREALNQLLSRGET